MMIEGGCAVSAFALRLLALLCMMMDHAGLALFPRLPLFRAVGRIAFPLYCFLLAEGHAHTHHLRRYATRLLTLALLSEAPFDWLIFGQPFALAEQNPVFSLLLGLICIEALQRLSGHRLAQATVLFGLCLCGMSARLSYGWLAPALCAAFSVARTRPKRAAVAILLPLDYSLFLLLVGVSRDWVALTLFAPLAALPILCYNGKPGPRNPGLQAAFYAAYPVHLLAFACLRALRIVPPWFG